MYICAVKFWNPNSWSCTLLYSRHVNRHWWMFSVLWLAPCPYVAASLQLFFNHTYFPFLCSCLVFLGNNQGWSSWAICHRKRKFFSFCQFRNNSILEIGYAIPCVGMIIWVMWRHATVAQIWRSWVKIGSRAYLVWGTSHSYTAYNLESAFYWYLLCVHMEHEHKGRADMLTKHWCQQYWVLVELEA